MSTNTYRIILQVRPGVILDDEIEIITPNAKYVFENLDDSNSECILGIRIIATIATNSLESALDEARSFADGFLEYLSYLSRTGIPIPDLVKGYEITSGEDSGEYLQFYHDWEIPSYSSRNVRDEDVGKIIKTLKKKSSESMHYARRAIHWYRVGIQSMNNIDKFLSFFIGLETMNSILRKRYGLGVEYLKCPNCKKQSGFPTSNGMREHIKKLYPETKYWKRIRRLRNDITHGEVEFKNILDETLELLHIIENSLLNALDQFFGIEKLEYKMGESLACYRPIVGSIAVTISGPNLEYLKEHEPNISSELRNVKSLKGNKVDADLYSTIRIPEGYSFELKRINLRIMEHFADIDFKRARFKTEFIKIQ